MPSLAHRNVVSDDPSHSTENEDGFGNKADIDPSKLLTVNEAAERLHVSLPTVYTRIHQGFLHPIRLGKRVYFQPNEVDGEFQRVQLARQYRLTPGRAPGMRTNELTPSLQKALKAQEAAIAESKAEGKSYTAPKKVYPNNSIDTYKGDIAANVTKLFNKGLGVREAVVECEITYELAKHLHEEWKTAGPELHLSPKQVAQLQARFDWWERPTADGFVIALNRYLQREIERTSEEIIRGMKGGAVDGTGDNGKTVQPEPVATVTGPVSVSAPGAAATGPAEREPTEAERLAIEAAFKQAEEEDKE